MSRAATALLANAVFWLGLAQLPAPWIILILVIPGAFLWFAALCILGGLFGEE
jgi:hypothetical protein